MGYGDNLPSKEVVELTHKIIDEISQICTPEYGYKICTGEITGVRSIKIGNEEFHPGSIITKYLTTSEQFIIVVATAGVAFDKYLKELHTKGDILNDFIADSLGSAIAEATIEKLLTQLETEIGHISNSYSPGYCGWHVKEQQKLFKLLPTGVCGITLNDSSLMNPIKSISAVIGYGKDVIKKPYGCAICEKKDCYKRKLTI